MEAVVGRHGLLVCPVSSVSLQHRTGPQSPPESCFIAITPFPLFFDLIQRYSPYLSLNTEYGGRARNMEAVCIVSPCHQCSSIDLAFPLMLATSQQTAGLG